MQVIASIIRLQMDRVDDPFCRALLADIGSRIEAMALVHEKLRDSRSFGMIEMGNYTRDLVRILVGKQGTDGRIRLELTGERELRLGLESAIPCGLVLNELIMNSLCHAFPGNRTGTIAIALAVTEGGRITITVADDGGRRARGL